MAPSALWQDPEGLNVIQEIVKKRIPQWKNGLRPVQLDAIAKILDAEDLLCIVATGYGKSALFFVPILIHLELHEQNELYGIYSSKARSFPIGVAITPTKGLAANLVHELSLYNIPALAYCHSTLTEARKAGISLTKEIMECKKYKVIFVDPEHLKTKEWHVIASSERFRANLLFGCVDEAHMIDQWGSSFRKDFSLIGQYFRSHFPSRISIFAITATMQPGEPTMRVCKSLGFVEGSFHLLRHSNERPDMHLVIDTLKSPISGSCFPELLSYLSSGRKSLLHCRTLDIVHRIHAYLVSAHQGDVNPLRRFRVYSSLCSDEYNKRSIYLIDNDPFCQGLITTPAFSNGMNSRESLDSISVECEDEVDLFWQQAGRAGRKKRDAELRFDGTGPRGVLLVSKHTVNAAEKQHKGSE